MGIGNYKFDLRIYVLCTSFKPFNLWIFREGLVRFSTQSYDMHDLTNVYSHLTNSSINKHSEEYNVEKNIIGTGAKWKLSNLWKYLEKKADVNKIWSRICEIV